MEANTGRQGGKRLAQMALGSAVLILLAVVLMGPAYRVGLVPLGPIFGVIFPYGTYAAIAVAGLSVVGLLVSGAKRRFAAATMFAAAALLCGGLVMQMLEMRAAARVLPPIHDVTTNLDDIPEFRVLSPRADEEELRVPARDPSMEAMTPTERWRRYHESAYADLGSLSLDVPADEAAALAGKAARDMGWEVVDTDAAAGRLEATATTAWFGFKDDVVVRIEALGADSAKIDVRSVSRVGVSDIGANAARIRGYLAALEELARQSSR